MIENQNEARDLAAVVKGRLGDDEFIKKYPGACSARGGSATLFGGKMGMANQTTMLKGESLEIQNILRAAFVERYGEEATRERFRSFDTICGATQDRQDALRNLLKKPLDLLLIVGGFNSSNTTHLAEIANGVGAHGRSLLQRYHIEGAQDILSPNEIRARSPQSGQASVEEGWMPEKLKNIGITSGASTPDVTLFEIIQKLVSCQR